MKKLYLLIMLACIPFSLFSQGALFSRDDLSIIPMYYSHGEKYDSEYGYEPDYESHEDFLEAHQEHDFFWGQDETNVHFHWNFQNQYENLCHEDPNCQCEYDFDFNFVVDARSLKLKKNCWDISKLPSIKKKAFSMYFQIPCDVDEKTAYMTHESDSNVIITLPKSNPAEHTTQTYEEMQ